MGIFSSLDWIYFWNIKIFLNFLQFFTTEMVQAVVTVEDKDLVILYRQYHDYRWPDNARSHGISSDGIDLVPPE